MKRKLLPWRFCNIFWEIHFFVSPIFFFIIIRAGMSKVLFDNGRFVVCFYFYKGNIVDYFLWPVLVFHECPGCFGFDICFLNIKVVNRCVKK